MNNVIQAGPRCDPDAIKTKLMGNKDLIQTIPRGWARCYSNEPKLVLGQLNGKVKAKNAAKRNMSSTVCASSMYKSLAPTPIYM